MMDPAQDGSLDTQRDEGPASPEVGIEQVWRSAFDHMLNGFCLFRAIYEDDRVIDFRYAHTNEAFSSLTGLRDVVGRRASEVTPHLAATEPYFFDLCTRVVRTGEPMRFEAHLTTIDQWIEVSMYRPAPDHLAATFDVITERKRTQAVLKASEERYRSLVENLDDVVFSTDLEGIITFVNPSVSRFGYRPEELVGRSRDEFMHPDDLPRLRELARRGPPTHGPIEYRIVGAAGKVHTVRSATHPLVVGASVVGATGVIVDLTTQRETEEQLRAAQRMEAVGRLAGGVAHDFNNLLTVILSYTQLAKGTTADGDALRGDLDEIERAAQRAESLTRQLLAFSRRQVLRPERVSLNDLVGGLSKMLQRLIGEHVELTVDLTPQLFDVQADRGQIEQVIMNLVLNARDAMPGGGRVRIATSSVTLDGARAEKLQVADGVYAELSVIDTGHGMDDATRARVFEPFFTTKPVGKGTGLGLSMVYGLVKQSGGAVTVESQPDRGASFRVFLPRHKGEPAESARPPSVSAAPGSETILFVEDEGALRNAASRMLSSTGYSVITAADAFEALRLIELHGPRIRLVVTDVVMPGMNGRELADRLARVCPDLKVLFTSGYTDETIAEHGVLGRAFLPKPYEMRALTASVRRLLDEG